MRPVVVDVATGLTGRLSPSPRAGSRRVGDWWVGRVVRRDGASARDAGDVVRWVGLCIAGLVCAEEVEGGREGESEQVEASSVSRTAPARDRPRVVRVISRKRRALRAAGREQGG